MKLILTAALLLVAASTHTFAQEGFNPSPNPPRETRNVVETLRAAGNFKTFLSLLEKAGIQDSSLREPTTIFAPTDDAFARLPKGMLAALAKDPKRLRALLLSHMVPGRVMIADLSVQVNDGTSRTLKSRQGAVLSFERDARMGMNSPLINGVARVGKFHDVLASEGVIHEIDAVLMADGSVMPSGVK
jgi:uncharacterized surface protein with fasciclin (FAS1) repeats